MGSGLEGVINGQTVRVGSYQIVHGAGKPETWAARALRRATWRSALSVFVAVDGRTIGAVLLADELRRETPHAVQTLRNGRRSADRNGDGRSSRCCRNDRRGS